MQLYSRNISPYSARVRISLRAKRIAYQTIDDPDVNATAFVALNPLRRVPVLVLDDGRAITESETIVEYLEEAFPAPSLLPSAAAERAQVRMVARVAELYVFPAVLSIFGGLAAAPANAEAIDALFKPLDNALAQLSSFMIDSRDSWHAFGDQLTIADGALAPFLFYARAIGSRCARDPLANHPHLQQFWNGAQSDAVLSVAIGEIGQAMAARAK